MDAHTAAGRLVLFGGPAGAGKSTLARRWCAARTRAIHIELDRVREMIAGGLADPQAGGELQAAQYRLSVAACVALAGVFLRAGYDAAIDDVLEPEAFERYWRPELREIRPAIVIVLPGLQETLSRSARREKRVRERHTRAQYAACLGWPPRYRVDTTGLAIEDSVALVSRCIGEQLTAADQDGTTDPAA